MKAVACVYWEGKFRNREKIYSPEWVYKLKKMVTKQMPVDNAFRFICFTNVPEKFNDTMETVPLVHNWPGWWSKIELFKPGVFDKTIDKVLYLDLDVVVLRPLKALFDYDNSFAILGTGNGSIHYEKDGKRTIQLYNSSVMCFIPDKYNLIYEEFLEDSDGIMKFVRGDQDWIGVCYTNLKHYPDGWIVKLRDLRGKEPGRDTKIVMCMNGRKAPLKNKSAAEQYKWISDVWN